MSHDEKCISTTYWHDTLRRKGSCYNLHVFTILQDLSLYCFIILYNIKKFNMNGPRMRLVEQDSLMSDYDSTLYAKCVSVVSCGLWRITDQLSDWRAVLHMSSLQVVLTYSPVCGDIINYVTIRIEKLSLIPSFYSMHWRNSITVSRGAYISIHIVIDHPSI